jgi:hypothetical protein
MAEPTPPKPVAGEGDKFTDKNTAVYEYQVEFKHMPDIVGRYHARQPVVHAIIERCRNDERNLEVRIRKIGRLIDWQFEDLFEVDVIEY